MNTNRTFIAAVLGAAVLFLSFVFFYENYNQTHEQKAVDNHARVVANSLWAYHPGLARNYLQLACRLNKYKKLVVTSFPDEAFIVVDNELESPIDLFFSSLALLRNVSLTSDVRYQDEVIGKLSVQWVNTSIYTYIYAFVLVFLLLTVFWFILRTLGHKRELEALVQKRTQYLKKEIADRQQTEVALKESELKYSDLVRESPDAIITFDEQGNFLSFNPAAERISGFSSQEVVGQNFRTIGLLTPEAIPEAQKNFARVLAGEKLPPFEFEARHKDTSTIVAEVNPHLIKHKGRGGWVQLILRNITERKMAEQAKKIMEGQLRQAQKMEAIGTLAGGIAHDFNNILAGIIGFTELSVTQVEKGTGLYSNLQEVLKAGNRAKDLVQQILTFSRQADLEQRPVQVSRVIKEVIRLLRSTLPTTIQIKQNIQSNALVIGDPTQIHQVLMNLCTNAGHAMSENGGILEIGLMDVQLNDAFTKRNPDLQPGAYVGLTVSDTGCGMPPAVLERIFEPFFTTKEKGQGTGMGLSVVHGIVTSHGGTILADSEPGKGTTFKVLLPAYEKQSEPDLADEAPLRCGSERILFIDDEPELVKLGRRILESLGYQATTRTSSLEALELFKSRPDQFDLVITDMTMPHLTGDELAVKLMAVRPDIPIILCTGFSNKINQEKAASLGIRELLMKPVVRRDIATMIRKVLDAT
jgi:PAS domain S-box-containing protein